jgi:GNAT superfamily N-acetyltransferase
MSDTFKTVKVETDEQIAEVVHLASVIWHEHFTPIIGAAQVDYMLEKFQSESALNTQLSKGYEYDQILHNHELCGYCGHFQEHGKLFLSKLYLKKECRGQHLSTKTFHFLVQLCRERKLKAIWLTCNKYNTDTLAVYHHLGFKTIDSQVADIGNGYVMDDYILEYTLN